MHIAIVICDRANYGRLQPVMQHLKSRDHELTVIASGSAVLSRFKYVADDIREDGYRVEEILCSFEGSTPQAMAQSVAASLSHHAAVFERLAPDFVIVIGDRHEALGAALGAAYTGQCLVHFQGGESSGTIDESARHAITQLAHYHVPATQRAKARLVQMCQRESTILTVGCPSSDLARSVMPEDRDEILVVYHPSGNLHEVEQILQARADLEGGLRWRWLWPNIDAGANEIHKLLRRFKAEWGDGWIDFETNMAPRDYLKTLASVRCAVGNSSSFVRDSSFFGTPVVLVGERQMGREHAANVMHAGNVGECIRHQLRHGRYSPSGLYGDGFVSERFARALEGVGRYTQKWSHHADLGTCAGAGRV